jgi:hypothetical protein
MAFERSADELAGRVLQDSEVPPLRRAAHGQVLQPGASELQPPNGVVESQLAGHVVLAEQVVVEAGWHVTSHAHDWSQVTPLHALLPAQSTLQAALPHVMLRQLRVPLHVILHALLLVQLMAAHESVAEQVMLQLHPVGQASACLQLPDCEQSMLQVLVAPVHEVHCDGHCAASVGGASIFTPASIGDPTQRPSEQVRPSAQSDVLSQAKSPLRWLTEQLPAAIAASPRTPSQSATSFTASLRS